MNIQIDTSYVVNLDTRPDRWVQFAEGIDEWESAFGIRPERFSAISGCNLPSFGKPWIRRRVSEMRDRSWGGKAGCILSHATIIRDAASARSTGVLILEDDAYITQENAKVWSNELLPALKALPENWAGIYLCTTKPISPLRLVGDAGGVELIESVGAFGTVAYLLNGRVLESLCRELPDEKNIWPWVAKHKTIDRWLSRNLMRFGQVYVTAPSVVGHREGASDIDHNPKVALTVADFELKDLPYVDDAAFERGCRRARIDAYVASHLAGNLQVLVKRLRGL